MTTHNRVPATLRRTTAAAAVLAIAAVAACAPGDDPEQPAPGTSEPPSAAPTSEPEEPTGDPGDQTSSPPEESEEPSDEPSETETETETEPPELLAQAGVSGGHPIAVEVGVSILNDGGNAADAAIATAFAISVVEPFASGIGGGGATLVVSPDGGVEPVAYDYREVVADNGVIPANEVGIPGFVAGMATIHENHATMPWEDLIAPAIELAEDGVPVSGMVAQQLTVGHGPTVVAQNPAFSSGGGPLREGDLLVQPELAQTFRVIARDGADAFYTGALVSDLTAVEGIDADSLANYSVAEGAPVRGAFGDYEVLSAMPALPGVGLIQQLQIAEALGVDGMQPGTAEFVASLAQAWGVADESMNTVVGDPAFVDVPVEELTDAARNADLAAGVSLSGSLARPQETGSIPPAEGGNTTQVTVVDRDGLSVSMTNTIMRFWGSGISAGGFFLNDQLSRFETVGTTSANDPSPGRKSVSWATPTILIDEQGRPVLVLGSPGGRQIPNVLSEVLVRWALHDESLQAAVTAPRTHAEGTVLRVERMPSATVLDQLTGYGYTIEVMPAEIHMFGSVQALAVDYQDGTVTGAQDDRREGSFTIIDP